MEIVVSSQMVEKIAEIKTFMQAVRACIFQSGLTDKYVYLELEIDSSHWSKMMQGLSHFPPEKLLPLMQLCGNYLPLHWLAYQAGFELRTLPKALEQELEKERAEKEELKAKLAYLESLITTKEKSK
jgi:hypothetical protein